MKLKLSIGNSRMDKKWNAVEMELSEFRDRISQTKRTAETVEQYRKLSKAKQDDIKDVGGFVLGTLKGGRRKKDCVLTRSGLSLDMDYATPDIIDQIEMFFSFQCYFYSTHKHTPEKPRLRLIIPLSREVTPDEYCAVARKVAEDIGIELFDDTTYEPSRLMYWPSTSADGEFVFHEIEGDLLNPDTVLSRYTDWHNTAEWPVSKRQQSVVQRDIKKQADPLTKPGTVGAFCRTYSVGDAIDTRQDLWFSTKDTIAKVYDGEFKKVFEEEFESYKAKFDELGITDFYTLIDDAVARVIRSQGGFIWACKNYDGDVMSDMVSTAFGSLAMMTSVLVSPDGTTEYEAAHGTVTKHYYKHLKGEQTSTNPMATIFAWSGALRKRGQLDGLTDLAAFADKLEAACFETLGDGIMTKDLVGLVDEGTPVTAVNSSEFIGAIHDRLAAKL